MRKADIPPEQLPLKFESSQWSALDCDIKAANVFRFERRTEKPQKSQLASEASEREEHEIIQRVLSKAKLLGW